MSSEAILLGSLVASFEHGLLLIEDSKSSASHEDWDAATEYVHFDDDSLYVAVQSVVDGLVSVTVYRDGVPSGAVEGFVEVFSGEFQCRSRRICVRDSDDNALLSIAAPGGDLIRLHVFADAWNWATRVVVGLEQLNHRK
ncbi:hypothetical protein [Streptomyces hoynatensis]|uniref:hypothetical protein n=1 Tax=Streptomyces hoynatensis TaxID=1141874 RepID=UPI0011C4779F|nr:hypothetical protein [Streptomyces hoynatensis]